MATSSGVRRLQMSGATYHSKGTATALGRDGISRQIDAEFSGGSPVEGSGSTYAGPGKPSEGRSARMPAPKREKSR